MLHTGKYEELIVCSHEIAASTAQLVAASKVGVPLHLKHSRVMCNMANKEIVKELSKWEVLYNFCKSYKKIKVLKKHTKLESTDDGVTI